MWKIENREKKLKDKKKWKKWKIDLKLVRNVYILKLFNLYIMEKKMKWVWRNI